MAVLPWMILGGGVLSIGFGLLLVFQVRRTRRFLDGAVTVAGTCVSVASDSSGEGDTTYYHGVDFTTPDGRQHHTSLSDAGYTQPGDTVLLVMTPGEPSTVRGAEGSHWGGVGVLVFFTGICTLTTLILIGIALNLMATSAG